MGGESCTVLRLRLTHKLAMSHNYFVICKLRSGQLLTILKTISGSTQLLTTLLFLAAPSSSRSLVVRWLVGWLVGWSVGHLCEKVTFRVYLKPTYLSTYATVVTVVTVGTVVTVVAVVTVVTVVTVGTVVKVVTVVTVGTVVTKNSVPIFFLS